MVRASPGFACKAARRCPSIYMATKKRKIAPSRAKPRRGGSFRLRPIGVICSIIKDRREAPMQGSEGAPDAWILVNSSAAECLCGLELGDEIIVLTWFHKADRSVLQVHPRSDPRRQLTGVFATRSPDRPNPIGLHRVTVREISGSKLRVGPIEAIDGTPVVDMKPVLAGIADC
jgi:tRNA-Thr(GGU) m(6)t(6)A37 methyltransferase TsaA